MSSVVRNLEPDLQNATVVGKTPLYWLIVEELHDDGQLSEDGGEKGKGRLMHTLITLSNQSELSGLVGSEVCAELWSQRYF